MSADILFRCRSAVAPSRSTTQALGVSPRFSSGMAATPTSRTAGWLATASSTSLGHTCSFPIEEYEMGLSRAMRAFLNSTGTIVRYGFGESLNWSLQATRLCAIYTSFQKTAVTGTGPTIGASLSGTLLVTSVSTALSGKIGVGISFLSGFRVQKYDLPHRPCSVQPATDAVLAACQKPSVGL